MIVRQAKEVARQWVMEKGRETPGFHGAFYHGSINWLDDDNVLPSTSDVDLMIVLSSAIPRNKLGKFIYRDVLLEVSWLAKEQIATAEQILGNYQLAGNFRRPNIIADPSGELTRLQAAIPGAFAKQRWVMKRCEHARGNVLDSLSRLHTAAAFHEQVTAWLFAAGITTHILLTAGLKNPTVRRRYAAVRRLLAQHGRGDFHERLLELLGCGQMRQGQAERHLVALARAFDAAKGVVDSSYPFAADLSDAARAVAIDGSRELIERGLHREAVFWMVATSSRCQAVFHQNASQAMQEEYSNGFRALLGDLGITSFADLERRGEEVRAFLPRVWEVAEALMAANPEIEDAVQE